MPCELRTSARSLRKRCPAIDPICMEEELWALGWSRIGVFTAGRDVGKQQIKDGRERILRLLLLG